ncbi:RNA-directed DNA polymerase (Reverse transcriptase), Ribonuclease H-like protein [Gossypium australe]|uniref:RNA-directed DNA polymerase (Reverse transcriptase), Ribonuclease H-like protein n=1 Tax=Gossypium australe TaxID=47621 RepID=A0A5B6X6F0_9ROSI|nr:RNA-directed DNA polymerase (Reverse transcriptase), Ribonuclease H-like protein [Gossypium australe]
MQDQLQAQLQEQLAKVQQEMRDQILESQRSTINQLAQLLAGEREKGKGTAFNSGDAQSGDAFNPDKRSDSCSNPRDNPTNLVVPDLDDVAEMKKVRVELPMQLEDRCRWLEEKFRAIENADYHFGIDAKDLSLVPDLVFPLKFKTLKFEKYNGTSCPEAHITMFYRRMTGYVNNDQLLIHCFQDNLIGSAAKCPVYQPYVGERYEELLEHSNVRELYPSLFDAHVASPFYLKPMQPPFPKWYDANAQCKYHAGITGHSIENCTAFKKLVERFIKMGIVKFDDPSGPNVAANPLPSHFDKGDSKKVPWNYDCNVTIPGEESPISASEEGQEVGFYTRSGWRYDPSNARAEPIKGKTPMVEQEKTVKLKLSETHRDELMKVLNETYVANDISVNKLNYVVNNISADNFIFFNDDEIPLGGMGSTKALHIISRCKGYTLPGVLIDNGSALNVLPLSTLNRLPMDSSHMRTCQNTVRAFDGTERRVMGRIQIPLLIGPNTYEVGFLVMDIKPSYNCLLGRLWIHTAGAVPSSLHQKLKLVTEGQLRTWKMPTRKGRGTYAEGQMTRFGLIFKPNTEQRKKEMEKKQEKRRARLSKKEVKWEPMTFPHISKTFISGGTIYPKKNMPREETAEKMLGNLNINVISEEGFGGENLSDICPYIPRSVLNNWTAEEIHVVFRANTESPDINDMSDIATDSKSPFEQDMCTKDSQDFKDDRDRNLSPELLRMVEQDEKQILPYKKSVEISYQDMPGLSTDVMVHRLPIKEECKLVQQKLRRMRPNVLLKIKEEVKKQFNAAFLRVVKYSEWVANIVPVPKKDGKVRMCVDYRDLNKASLKKNFPLPHIDTLVDNMAGYSLFSFMDGFLGYNQIKMYPEDMEKTTFVAMWGTFCYKVYVDDKIAKSRTEKEHIQVLRKLFLRLRKFQLMLNPVKCTFRARFGKLLGFIVNKKGIEIDLDKVKAIQKLLPPRTQKKVRGFLGRLNYIARFISQLTEKCDPIFHLLKNTTQAFGMRSAKRLSIRSNITCPMP